ncbi:MAG: hypothetical protein DRP84_12405 [Spirochaetes bacterium]|nr:MAG: hypothetical protein DRP84_12405 [Spirochaetota bacterium]
MFKLWKISIFLLTISVNLFNYSLSLSAEISEKKDIAIFGVSSHVTNVSEDLILYIDSSINHYFIKQKRFNVLGYGDYRLKSESIDNFIERIREIRAKKAEEAGVYDEKFGTVVIKGEDFDRIVNSFLVVIPVLSNYNVKDTQIEEVSGSTKYLVNGYTVGVVVDITFINVREGKKEASIRLYGEGTDTDYSAAKKKAVDNAVAQLPYRVKKLDIFKIKSGVLMVKGDTVIFALGEDMGVRPGDEYEVITKHKIGNSNRVVKLPTALIRVKRVYPDHSEGRIVYQKERITEGDQLVEVARAGVDISINTGIMKVNIPDMNYSLVLVDDSFIGTVLGNHYYFELNQPSRNYIPEVSLSIAKRLGYRFKVDFNGIGMLNFPIWGGIGELGIVTSLYKRRLGIDFGVYGGILYMSTFKKRIYQEGILPSISIEGTEIDYDQDPYASIYGLGIGLKGSTGIEFVVGRNSSVRATVSYRLYTSIKNWMIHIEETSGDVMESVTIGSDSDNIFPYYGSMKMVNINGLDISIGYNLRF